MRMWRQTLEYQPVIGYRFIPGIKARVDSPEGGYLIQVNDAGFRCNHDFQKRKKPGLRRILLFGDSFTAGDGVPNAKRYGDILEGQIPHLEVYNFGLPGTGTDQQYLAYKEYSSDIDHDLLIISVFVENVKRVYAHYRYYQDEGGRIACYAKPYFLLENGKLALRNVPPARQPVEEASLPASERKMIDRGSRHPGVARVIGKVGAKRLIQRLIRYQPSPEYGNPRSQAWIILRGILEEWIKNHPRPVLLMVIPKYQYVEQTADPSSYQARFSELVADTACAFHDPLADLWKYPMEERRRFRFSQDEHLTYAGHLALARSMLPKVSSLLNGAA